VAPRPPTPSPTRELEEFADDEGDDVDQEYRPPAEETGDTDDDDDMQPETRRRGDPIPPDTPTGKRHTNDWSLTDEAEKRAIPYLEAHEVLWDNAHKDHGKKDVVADGWKEGGARKKPSRLVLFSSASDTSLTSCQPASSVPSGTVS
jgi:hypothetical protein